MYFENSSSSVKVASCDCNAFLIGLLTSFNSLLIEYNIHQSASVSPKYTHINILFVKNYDISSKIHVQLCAKNYFASQIR